MLSSADRPRLHNYQNLGDGCMLKAEKEMAYAQARISKEGKSCNAE